MEFGIFSQMHVPNDDTEHARFARELEASIAVDAAGFKYNWAPEHHFLKTYSHQPAPEIYLSWVAAQTKKIHVGFAIVNLTAPVEPPGADRRAHRHHGPPLGGARRGGHRARLVDGRVGGLRDPHRRRDQAHVARVDRAAAADVARRTLRVRGQVLPHAEARRAAEALLEAAPAALGRVLEPADVHRGGRARAGRALLHVRHAGADRRVRPQLQGGGQALHQADRRLRQRQHRRHHEHVLPARRRQGAAPLLEGARRGVHRGLLLLARLDPAPGGIPERGSDQDAAGDDAGSEGRSRGAAAGRWARPRRSPRSSRCTRPSASTSSSTRP